jgi:hypothetical protein
MVLGGQRIKQPTIDGSGEGLGSLLKIGTCSAFEMNEYKPTYKVGKTRSAFERNLNFASLHS